MENLRQRFNSKRFAKQYHYNGALGAVCSSEGTTFRLWAPTAVSVELRLYQKGHGVSPYFQTALSRQGRGVWVWSSPQNLDGVYYDYVVTAQGVSRETADPYARACGLNGSRSMVIDLFRTNPKGWERDVPPARQPEDIIYELHVREFSWAESGGFPKKVRGKYKAFCCTDTTLHNDGAHPTGIGWIKQLGVTHVQLMPVFDYASVDEENPEGSFNWGYDPLNYNIPEGSYSTDPTRGEVRIREFKEMVQSLHQNGFRVVMDVVYNHTYHRDSWLERTVPGYYYRQYPDGRISDGSGCGNDIASERSMCAKYILDSVLYWAEEYHIDGFRFDLMGLLDTQLMETIRKELDARWGRGEKLVYGEPWTAWETSMARGFQQADKKHLAGMDPEIGAFCDGVRDGIKGSVMDAASRGFVNGGRRKENEIFHSISGWCGKHRRFSAAAPSQVINYLSCHDDMTVWDKLVFTLDPQKQYDVFSPQVLRANRLAAAICFTCQGRLFLLSGEEFGRTKEGEANTYCASITLNRLDWERAWQNRELAEYYQGLFALRKTLPALCDKSGTAWERILQQEILRPGCVQVLLDNTGGSYRQILLVYNASQTPQPLLLEDGWFLLADGENSFLWQEEHPVSQLKAEPVSVVILGKK